MKKSISLILLLCICMLTACQNKSDDNEYIEIESVQKDVTEEIVGQESIEILQENKEPESTIETENSEWIAIHEVDWNAFESVMDSEEYQALQEYMPVLSGEREFIWSIDAYATDAKEHRNVTVDEFCYILDNEIWSAEYNPDDLWVNSIAVCDLDENGSKELILLLENIAGHYLILHKEDGEFYGTNKVYRAFEMLQTNGVYISSGGAAHNYYYKIQFQNGDYEETLLGYTDFDYEKNEEIYYIEDKRVEDYETFETWVNSIMSEDVIYHRVSSEGGTAYDYYMVATSLPASEVEQYALEVKQNIMEGNWAALSKKISYPITISGVPVDDESAFQALELDIRISCDFVEAIEAESCQQMFCNWQGISMGATGQIWIGSIPDENSNYELKIIGINGMLTEGEANGELLERFYEQVYGGDLSTVNIEERLAHRGGCYQESSYYEDITYYWERIRGVTDISNLTDPLYFTDMKYYTAEDFANDMPVAIHLAKNEIYAKRGYIFKSEDLNNYFLGCAWYTPLYTAEKFDDSVFNDYERKNLEILAELDAGDVLTSSQNETSQEKLTVEEAWELLKANYTFLETSELEEISYDDKGNMQIVIDRGYWPWSDEEFDRFCESLIFYNCEEDSCYLFGHHYVYYEENEETIFATQTKGWYQVDYYTGEVSRW